MMPLKFWYNNSQQVCHKSPGGWSHPIPEGDVVICYALAPRSWHSLPSRRRLDKGRADPEMKKGSGWKVRVMRGH